MTNILPARPSALPGQEAVNQDLIDEAVIKINRWTTNLGLELTLRIGDYLLDKFFGGDPGNLGRVARGHVSFRALADREDLDASYATLWYSTQIARQYDQLPAVEADRLSIAHHKLLLPVKDEALKSRLARQAVEENLSKRQFAEVVRAELGTRSGQTRGGRPPLPGVMKALRAFQRALPAAPIDEEAYSSLSVDKKKEVLSQARERLQELTRLVQDMERDLDPDIDGGAPN